MDTETKLDFSAVLHGERSQELRRLPAGARVVLSGGANARWYFDWFEEHYPGSPVRHIGVEALAPKPADLPENVEWVSSSLGDLGAVASGTVDLVFAGEVIEHLWPQDIAGFLLESHRVLAPGGHLALDSPNRSVTEPLSWLHPEHTVEFSVDEITELLTLAGFELASIRGLILCYDRSRHRYMPIDPLEVDGFTMRERLDGAAEHPEDAFVWWAQAVRSDREPDEHMLRWRIDQLFERFRARRREQLNSSAGVVSQRAHHGRFVRSGHGEAGLLIHGPTMAMPPGEWNAEFELATTAGTDYHERDEVVAILDVVTAAEGTPLARAEVRRGDVALEPGWSRHRVRLSLAETTMGLVFRLQATGAVPLYARFAVDVVPAGPEPAPSSLARELARQATGEAKLRARPVVRRVRALVQRVR
jgi:SAM-dependent methyltransferase